MVQPRLGQLCEVVVVVGSAIPQASFGSFQLKPVQPRARRGGCFVSEAKGSGIVV